MKKLPAVTNKGAALVTVIMVMLVIMMFTTIVLTLVTSETKTGLISENNIQALHSAEAGINKYLWYLNKDTATPIPFNTVINYPEYNPVSAYRLSLVEDTPSKKVISSTGWELKHPDIKRTVQITFTKRSFTQYVYFSNDEPDTIFWTSADKCYGPYHTNTSLYISGNPEFFGKVTYVNDVYPENGSSDHPIYHAGKSKVAAIPYPNNNTQLYNSASANGYVFQGRTSIQLNSNGKITVWNPKSNPNKVVMDLPPNGVIYVNGIANPSSKFDENAGNVFVSGVLNGKLTIAASNDIYITDYDSTYESFTEAKYHPTDGISYADTDFDINYTTGDVTVTGLGKDDMLGLVAVRYVSVLTYGWYKDNYAESAKGNIKIYGAIFAINGKFINSYQIGSSGYTYPSTPGKLSILGAIIQKTRGAVGLFNSNTNIISSGYAKDYAHDPRMMYEAPPSYTEPVDSGWEIYDWKEK